LLPYKTSARYLNYRVVKNIVATTISFSLVYNGKNGFAEVPKKNLARYRFENNFLNYQNNYVECSNWLLESFCIDASK